jgi:hypothetical protein
MMGSANRREPIPAKKEPPPLDQDINAEQEIDVWWGAHSSRALLPSLFLTILLAAAIALSAYIVWRHYDLPPLQVRYTAYALIGLVGFIQLWRWAYAVVTRTYRITSRRLFIEKSFRRVPFIAVELARVADIRVEQSAIQRRLKVGRVRLSVEGRRKPIFLKGIFQPGDLAIELRRLVQEARERTLRIDVEKSTTS